MLITVCIISSIFFFFKNAHGISYFEIKKKEESQLQNTPGSPPPSTWNENIMSVA